MADVQERRARACPPYPGDLRGGTDQFLILCILSILSDYSDPRRWRYPCRRWRHQRQQMRPLMGFMCCMVKSAAATAMEAEPPSTSNTAIVTSAHVLFVFYCGQ
jgi:hypothetical protein